MMGIGGDRIIHGMTLAQKEAAVAAIHPGPPPGWTPPAAPRLAPAERLAALERDLLARALDRFATNDSEMGSLARRIIVLRAEIGRGARG